MVDIDNRTGVLQEIAVVIPTYKACNHILGVINDIGPVLALLEDAGVVNEAFRFELSWRLNAALMLAEASPQGARRFLGADKPSGFFRSSLSITRAVLMEVGRRVVQLFLRSFLSKIGRQGIFR